MHPTTDTNFILIGSVSQAGTVTVCEPSPDQTAWTVYDVRPGGERINHRVVGRSSAHWRGVPECP